MTFTDFNMWVIADSYDNDESKPILGKAVKDDGTRDAARHTMFDKGQSKRIWGELYKVIDSSDVVIQVHYYHYSHSRER